MWQPSGKQAGSCTLRISISWDPRMHGQDSEELVVVPTWFQSRLLSRLQTRSERGRASAAMWFCPCGLKVFLFSSYILHKSRFIFILFENICLKIFPIHRPMPNQQRLQYYILSFKMFYSFMFCTSHLHLFSVQSRNLQRGPWLANCSWAFAMKLSVFVRVTLWLQ